LERTLPASQDNSLTRIADSSSRNAVFTDYSARFAMTAYSVQAARSFSVGGKRFNLLLLLRESRLEIFALLFNFAVLFKKLVEQLSDSPQMLVNSN